MRLCFLYRVVVAGVVFVGSILILYYIMSPYQRCMRNQTRMYPQQYPETEEGRKDVYGYCNYHTNW